MQEQTTKDESVPDQSREQAPLADTATTKSNSKLEGELSTNLDAKLEADFAMEVEVATSAGSNRSSSAAPGSRINSDRKQNSVSPNSKLGLKSDAKLSVKPAGNSVATPAVAPSVSMIPGGMSSAPVAMLPSVLENGDFSPSTPNLGDASNLQLLAEQFSAAVGSASSGSQIAFVPNAASNPSDWNATDSLATASIPIAPASPSNALPTGIDLAVSDAISHAADSFSDLAAQSSAGELQPPSPAVASADSSVHGSIPSAATALTIAPIGDIPTVAAAPLQSAVSTRATPLVEGASFQPASSQSASSQSTSPSLPNFSPETLTPPSTQSSTQAFSAAAISNIDSQASSASTLIPTAQVAASDSNLVGAGGSPTGMRATVPSSSGAAVTSMLVSSAMATPRVAEPASTSSSAPREAVPAQFHSPAVTPAVSRISGAPEPGPTIAANRNHDTSPPEADNNPTNAANENVDDYASNYVSNQSSSLNSSGVISTSTLTPDSATPLALSAATTNGPDGSAKNVAEAQLSSTATSPANASDKKSAAAVQPNAAPSSIAAPRTSSSGIPVPGTSASDTSASGSPASAIASSAASSHNVPVVITPGRDASTTLMVPTPPASSPAPPASSEPAPVLPQAHQMLDSASGTPTAPSTPIAPGSAADLQMNGQMHMGVRTDAFGAVEIHTVVAQSQVGITVHADRDVSRWFSSEVPGLESGLNNSHLNLTGVNFDHGRSGVQTATGFSNGQPRQNFSQPQQPQSAGSRAAATPEPGGPAEAATVDILPSGRSTGSLGVGVGNHFSVHV